MSGGLPERFRDLLIVLVLLAILALIAEGPGGIASSAEKVIAYIPQILEALLIIAAGKLFLDLTTPMIEQRFDKGLATVYEVFLGIAVVLIALNQVVAVRNFLISAGLIGAAAVFVLQRPLSDLACWLIIASNKPFREGDRLELSSMGLRGDVISIRPFYTILREVNPELERDSGRTLIIPNSKLLESSVIRYNPFIWDTISISITYESDWRLAMLLIKKVYEEVCGKEHEICRLFATRNPQKYDVDRAPHIFVQLAPSSIDIRVRYPVRPRKLAEIRTKLLGRILEELSRPELRGRIQIAYPHTEIVFKQREIIDYLRRAI